MNLLFGKNQKEILDKYGISYTICYGFPTCTKDELVAKIFLTDNIHVIEELHDSDNNIGWESVCAYFLDCACQYSKLQTLQCLYILSERIFYLSNFDYVICRNDDNIEILNYVCQNSTFRIAYRHLLTTISNRNIKMFKYLYPKVVKSDRTLEIITRYALQNDCVEVIDYLIFHNQITKKILLPNMTNLKLSSEMIKIIISHIDNGRSNLTLKETTQLGQKID
jgi:hypothetical protein